VGRQCPFGPGGHWPHGHWPHALQLSGSLFYDNGEYYHCNRIVDCDSCDREVHDLCDEVAWSWMKKNTVTGARPWMKMSMTNDEQWDGHG
jgi:hypothetical protein